MKKQYELIICIVNSGFVDTAMEAARTAGAGGGTVLNARGTAREEAEKTFDIIVTPEKEMVLILSEKSKRDPILHALYQKVGLGTDGQGIAFSVPVTDVVGISD